MTTTKKVLYLALVMTVSCSTEPALPAPELTSLEPDSGKAGMVIKINGKNFKEGKAANTVLFGSVPGTVLAASGGRLIVEVPYNKEGTYRVTVSSGTASSDGWLPFKYSEEKAGTALSEKLLAEGIVTSVKSESSRELWAGVKCTTLSVNVVDEVPENIFIVESDLSSGEVGMRLAMPYGSPDISGGWMKQTLSDMVGYLPRYDCCAIAMVNGDFWDTSTPINPRGPVHLNGSVVSSSWDYDTKLPQQALSFVGVTSEGRVVIKDRSEYESAAPGLFEATGAGFMFLKNGSMIERDGWTWRDPRTAIGLRDSTGVVFLTADGRDDGVSEGLKYSDMARIFKALGCHTAVNMDGGGSAQMLVIDPKTQQYSIINKPSDGAERPVINGWALTIKD